VRKFKVRRDLHLVNKIEEIGQQGNKID